MFFELGINWYCGNNIIDIRLNDYLFSMGNRLSHGLDIYLPREKEITIQDLRDMVAKKKGIKSIGVDLAIGEDKTMQVTGIFQDFEPRKEMTWEDALDAFKEGKDVEVKNISWFNIKDLKLENIKRGTAFRLAPQRITLNGEYTKEELLQKAGEME